MANKNISRILSGAAPMYIGISCVILLCTLNISGQGFRVKKLTFTISGSVGLSGVTMNGLPSGPIITDDNGNYSAVIEYGWSGMVTPQMEGYIFEPLSRIYSKVSSNQTDQDFTATHLTFTISGTTDIGGVAMRGLPGDPVTDENGKYSAIVGYGFDGVVTPTREGYTFTPPNRTYTDVIKDQTNQSYTGVGITFTISGITGIGSVVMKGLPNNPVTNESGMYSVTVNYGWTGTVTPTKAGYSFDPPNRQYTGLVSAQANQDYIAALLTFTISGTTNIDGVVMEGLPGKPITGGGGFYTTTVDYGWSGTVTPIKAGYVFTPTNKIYNRVTAEQTNQDYTSKVLTFIISGRVSQADVVMSGLPDNPVSGSDGTYKATVPYGWVDTVTPQKEGYSFTPNEKTYLDVTTNQINQDYSPARITFSVSGTTNGVAGVVMKGLPGHVTSDENGLYNVTVEYGWSGTVTPEKSGYTFEPAIRTYPRLISAEFNQDYLPVLEKHTISGRVISAKGPVDGVILLTDSGGYSATTNYNGEYSLLVDYGWSGIVTPEREGYIFKPSNKRYPLVTRDQANQDYTAEVIMLNISGTLEMSGVPLAGILMSASEGGVSDMTDAKGHYNVKVPYGWMGEVAPKKEGYTFDPPSESYTNVTTNYKDGVAVQREMPAPKPPILRPPTTTLPTTGPSTPGLSAPRTAPPGMETQGPSIEVPTVPVLEGFEQQKTQLEQQIGSLQQQMDDILGQLTGKEPVSPNIPAPMYIGVPGGIGPTAPKAFGGPLINYVCINKDLRQVLQEISEQAGINIYADDTVKGTVTCQFVNKPLEQALDEMLMPKGYAFKEIPDSYLVYMPISNTFADNDLRDVLQTIASQAGVVIIPDATVGGLITADLKEVPLETALGIVLAGTAFVVKRTPDYYLVASGKVDSEAFPAVSETRRVKMNYVGADTAMELLSTAFRPYVQAEVGTHTILITAPSVLTDRIISDLKQIDQPPRHVMLDARVVVMERGNLLNLGIEWGWPNISAGVFGSDFRGGGGDTAMQFGGKWPWGVQIGYTPDAFFTNSLLMTLNLLSQNNEADIVSTPQVLAQDGKLAELKVINEEYFFLTAAAGAAFYTESQLEQIEAGTSLSITPRIGDNNDITLEISAEVSDVVARGQETDEVLPLVTVTRRTATNTVRVKDGGTVAMAGLKESKRILEDKKTPGLSSIPLLGGLFSNKRDQTGSKEVLILITARLVPEMEGFVEVTETFEPSMDTIPPKSMGENEFKMRLQESLSRLK